MNDFGLAVMLVLAYLIGATPTSYIAGRLGKRIDLREHARITSGRPTCTACSVGGTRSPSV